MLNQTILVGRITEKPIKEDESNKLIIKLAIPRSYKNIDGEYEVDFIPCTLWNGIADSTSEYCKKGDLIGVKGRLFSEKEKIGVIAEKVTFLSTNKEQG